MIYLSQNKRQDKKFQDNIKSIMCLRPKVSGVFSYSDFFFVTNNDVNELKCLFTKRTHNANITENDFLEFILDN